MKQKVIMDTESTNFLISVLFAKAIQWGVPQLILAVLTTIAAWRHRSVGMWLLAIAAILTLAVSLWLAFLIRHSGGSPRDYRMVSYPNFLALLISIGGWAALAFKHNSKKRDDS
jgi:hypothetical protein